MMNALRRAGHLTKAILPPRVRDFLARAGLEVATDRYKLWKQYVDMFWALRNLKRLGFEPTTILDVGAFLGEWTLEMHAIFPRASYLLVEPLPDKKSALATLSERLGARVIVENLLVGSRDAARIPFFVMGTGSSVLEERSSFPREIVDIPMTTMDSLVAKHDLRGEFFLKMDVQGYELEVLKGAPRTMEHTNFILLEASLLNYNKKAPLVGDLVHFLAQRDFVLFEICNTHRKDEDNVLFQVDLIFARSTSELRQRANNFRGRT